MKQKTTNKAGGDQTGGMDHPIQTPVLTTKLHRPPLPADFIPRTELLKNLENNSHRPLILVSAPAGYGKSILISSWIERNETPVAWVSLDGKDNDLRVFLSYFVTAVKGCFPKALKKSGDVLQAVDLPPLTILSQTLINELDDIKDDFILVLDDYHRIDEKRIHELIETILRYPPQHMKLVLLSRRDPPLPLHDLRAHSQVVELRMKELSFTPEEIILLFKKLHGFTLIDTVSETLLEKTEGWITGLRLAALSINRKEDMQKLLESMDSDSLRSVSEFLIEEVLSKQPAVIQKNMLKTSVLNRFCAELLDELFVTDVRDSTAINDGATFLNWLEKAGMFVIPLDLEYRWFRYHHLFQELLQNRLKQHQKHEEIKIDHINVSDWFENNGFIEEAIEHALAAEDVERAAEIVERNRQSALSADQWYVLEKWLSRLPDSVVQQYVDLLLARAWVFLRRLQFEGILSILDQVESLLDDKSVHQPLRGEVAVFKGFVTFFQGDGARSRKLLEEALGRLPVSYHEPRCEAETMFALANQMEGQKEKAIHRLDEQVVGIHSPHSLRKARLLAVYVFVHIISGDLAAAEKSNRRFRDDVSNSRYVHVAAWAPYLQGLIHLYRNELEEVEEFMRNSIEQRFVHHPRAAVDSFIGLMLAYEVTEHRDEAQSTLQLLQDFVVSLDNPAYYALAESAEARLALLQGRTESAIRWLETSTPPPPEVAIFWLEVSYVTRCRALIAEGSTTSLGEAEKSLRKYAAMNEAHHNICQLIQILPLLAITCEKRGKAKEALGLLERAVHLAQPGGFILPFIEAGLPIEELLERLSSLGGGGYHLEKLLDAFKRKSSGEKSHTSENHQSKIIKNEVFAQTPEHEYLTQREIEIVSLLAEGLKNKEIAGKFSLSPTTIKKHIYNIYQKWDVHSRVSVVVKARERGIIS